MNEREQQIIKALLGFLDKLNGAQSIETIIHAHVQTTLRNDGEAAPSLAEFNACLMTCDKRGWIVGSPAKITTQMKWELADGQQIPVSVQEHRAILKAIAAGDADGAASALRAHVLESKERTLKNHAQPGMPPAATARKARHA